MKTLEEKKLLVQMSQMLGEPVDPLLLESIEKEEQLSKILFGEEQKAEEVIEEVIQKETVLLKEADPPTFPKIDSLFQKISKVKSLSPPAPPAVEVPPKEELVNQVVNVLKTANANISNTNVYRDKEIEGLRRSISEIMQKISTLSWGGGGTGAVRIIDQDDLDKSTVGNGKYMKFQDGWFVMDEINPFEVVHNTTLVTSNTYVVTDTDYYIGVNVPEYTTIILPLVPDSGRMLIVKDESGFAQLNPIKLDGNIDNDPDGAEIRINNGGVQLIYRNGWRIV